MATLISSTSSLALMVLSSSSRSFFFACVHFVFHAVCVYRFSGHFAFYWLG